MSQNSKVKYCKIENNKNSAVVIVIRNTTEIVSLSLL